MTMRSSYTPTGKQQPAVEGDQVDAFNALHDMLVVGIITEAEFRAAAVERFGYTEAEIRFIARRLRGERLP